MNRSGITPILDRVLVLPDEIEEKTDGGIIIAPQVQEQHQMAQATGTFIEAGPDAFIHSTIYVETIVNGGWKMTERRIDRWNPEYVPKPGDRVQFAKYGGLVNIGEDGKEYRILNDRDITCKVSDGVKYTGIQSRKAVQSER